MRLCFFEFLKLQLQRLCGDFLFVQCKTEFFLAVEILTADFFKQSQPILRKQKDDNSIQTGAVRLLQAANSKFAPRENKERYGSVAAAKALPRSQNSTR